MGVPCSKGLHKLKISGKTWEPKLIEIPFTSACGISIESKKADSLGSSVIGIEGVKMVALSSADVIYWELPDFNLGFPGDTISIVQPKIINALRKESAKGYDLNVRLLAKENSWSGKSQYFIFEGEVQVHLLKRNFAFVLKDTYPVSERIIDAFEKRCAKYVLKERCRLTR